MPLLRTLAPAHADMESQLRVCVRLCVTLPLQSQRHRPTRRPWSAPRSAQGPLLFSKTYSVLTLGWLRVQPFHICCHLPPPNDPAWMPLPSTFSTSSPGKANLTPELPASGLSVDKSSGGIQQPYSEPGVECTG